MNLRIQSAGVDSLDAEYGDEVIVENSCGNERAMLVISDDDGEDFRLVDLEENKVTSYNYLLADVLEEAELELIEIIKGKELFLRRGQE